MVTRIVGTGGRISSFSVVSGDKKKGRCLMAADHNKRNIEYQAQRSDKSQLYLEYIPVLWPLVV